MSANYWTSSQYNNNLYTKPELNDIRLSLFTKELQKYGNYWLTIPLQFKDQESGSNKQISIYAKELHYDRDYNLRIYLYLQLMKLGKKFQLKQVIISSAMIYLQRFLLKCSIKECNVYYLITTCLYLASKVEECPIHIKSLNLIAKSYWPDFIHSDCTKITEFEFYLIEELESYMIVYHPYDSLKKILQSFTEYVKENLEKENLDNIEDYLLNYEYLQDTWAIINDSYVTDSHLLFHPHVIAITSLLLSIVLKGEQLDQKIEKTTKIIKDIENKKNVEKSNNKAPINNKTVSSDVGSTNNSVNNTTNMHSSETKEFIIPNEEYDEMLMNLGLSGDNNIQNKTLTKDPMSPNINSNSETTELEEGNFQYQGLKEELKQNLIEKELIHKKTAKLNEFVAFSLINMQDIEDCFKEIMILYQFWTGFSVVGQSTKFDRLQKNKYNEEWIRFLLYRVYQTKA
ncbi:hypothetical protein FOG48_00604 [Hanseniaspora uvarum]|nr:hypothetical protein FOG48_00604 [Hanseniaspora uvarum]